MSVMCLPLSVSNKCEPDTGASASWYGPESGMEGRFQDVSAEVSGSEVADGLSCGAPPMIPPSRKRVVSLASCSKRAAISRAERGEMALRSR